MTKHKSIRAKICSMVLMAAMLLTMLPMAAFAAEGGKTIEVGDSLEWGSATSNVADGDTIKLTADLDSQGFWIIKPNANITVDLNGHTMTTNRETTATFGIGGGNVTVKNGTLSNTANMMTIDIAMNPGSLTLENVHVESLENSAINMGHTDSTLVLNAGTVLKSYNGNSTIRCAKGTSITVNAGVTIDSSSETSNAIYISDNTALTINEGATIIGKIYPYKLTVDGGYAGAACNGTKYLQEKTEVTLDAGMRDGYTFSGWTSSNGGTFTNASSAQTTFKMPKNDTTVTANWVRYIAASTDGNGIITAEVNGAVVEEKTDGSAMPYKITSDTSADYIVYANSKDTVVFTVTPNSGYSIAKLLVDGSNQGAISTYTFAKDTQNYTIRAEFSKDSTGGSSGSSGSSSKPSDKPATDIPNLPTVTFNDVEDSHWAKADIEFVAGRGLMNGTGNGAFSPNASMTRAMFVTTLGRLAKVDQSQYATSTFADVVTGTYYAPNVAWAAEKGIVSGIGSNKFAPDRSVTREEMAQIMMNYAKAMNIELPKTTPAASFTDAASISSFAAEAINAMQQAGIMNGKDGGKFDPQATASRAEVAAVLHRFVLIVEG